MIMNKDIESKKNQNLNSNLVAINKFFEGNNNKNLLHFVKELHNADIADLIQNLDGSKRVLLINNIKDDFDPEILTYLNESLKEEIIEYLDIKKLASLPSMETIRANILSLLNSTQRNILFALQNAQSDLVRVLNAKFKN